MIDIQAKALQMEQEFWVNTTLGSVRAWKIRRKGSLHRIVIFIGLGEFCEKYADFISFLNEQACEILIFDWPGLGLSGAFGKPSSTSHSSDFDKLIQAGVDVIETAGWTNKSFYVIGHSLGGHMAFRLAGLQKFPIAGIIALSPMMLPKISPLFPIYMLANLISIMGFGQYLIPKTGQNTLLNTRKFSSNNLLSRNQNAIENVINLINKNP